MKLKIEISRSVCWLILLLIAALFCYRLWKQDKRRVTAMPIPTGRGAPSPAAPTPLTRTRPAEQPAAARPSQRTTRRANHETADEMRARMNAELGAVVDKTAQAMQEARSTAFTPSPASERKTVDVQQPISA